MTDKKSLAKFGFDVNAKFHGVDPESGEAAASWEMEYTRKAWEHLAEVMEAEVLRRHGMGPTNALSLKLKADILKITRDLSR